MDAETIFSIVKDCILQHCKPECNIEPDNHWVDDLGLDSLDFIPVAECLEQTFDISINDFSMMNEEMRIKHIVQYLERYKKVKEAE